MLNIFLLFAFGVCCFILGAMFATDSNTRKIIRLQKAIIDNLKALRELRVKDHKGADDERKAD